MGRNIRGHEINTAKLVLLLCRRGQRRVSAMNGIEGAAEESYVHFVLRYVVSAF
jgi:hypothetical protein